MKVTGKHRADFVGLNVPRNQSNSGLLGYLDLEIGVDAETCATDWGEDFKALVFATVREVTDEDTGEVVVGSLLDSVKPGKRVVYEHHDVIVAGVKTRCQPDILRATMVPRKAAAVVKLRLTFELRELKKILEHIAKKPAAMLDVEFEPAQMGLGFNVTKAEGNGNGEPEEAEVPEDDPEDLDGHELEAAPGTRPEPMFDDDGNEVEAHA